MILASADWFNYLVGAVEPSELNRHNNSEELYFLLLVSSADKSGISISQNGMNQITLNNNHLNKDVINASISLSSFSSLHFYGYFSIGFCWYLDESTF